MTTKTYAADAARMFEIDALELEAAARRERDAYVAGLLSNALHTLTGGIGRWFERRRTIAALEQLDDRLMADIGLDRAAFAAGIVRRTAHEDRAQAIALGAATVRPAMRHAAEPHLAPAVAPSAANDSRRAA